MPLKQSNYNYFTKLYLFKYTVCLASLLFLSSYPLQNFAQLAGAVEYTDYTSAEG